MIDDMPGAVNLLEEQYQNVTCIIFFLIISEPSRLDWLFHFWRGHDIIKIVEWEADSFHDWALHIDLKALGKPREEAILPFPWDEDSKPTAQQGTMAWKIYANKE